ncbi:MAG: ABC transporter substrate-binding protein [Deltaproteobacteria bacterium]|nr:ABC transporter substrate-binding protein [Deltaproteobacteria bacterium]
MKSPTTASPPKWRKKWATRFRNPRHRSLSPRPFRWERARVRALRTVMSRLSPRKLVWHICAALLLTILNALPATSQDKRTKVRISNAGLTITALPLLAARDWGVFKENGLDVEIVVMSPPLGAAAMNQGDIDYVAGVGPASVAATLTGLPSRAIWFSSDRISYWLQSAPQYKSLQELKGKKIALSGGVGGTNHVALLIALEKSGANPKDYVMVAIPGQQLQIYYSLESGFVEAALMSPPHIFAAAKKGFHKILDVGAMVEMPGGGLTAMVKTIQERPAETRRVIRALQVAKDEVRKSKPRTVELIMRLLKMDKDGAGETYDAFLTTLNPSGLPNRAGIDNLVRSLQAQGRFVDRKVNFAEVADDRLATEVAKELGYKLP